MNPSFPDWTVAPQTQLPLLSHKNNKPNNFNLGLDGELVELIWENGQVVLHTQTHRHPKPGHEEQHTNTRQLANKHVHNPSPSAVPPPRGSVLSCENPVNNLVQDAAETVSWLDCHVDDPFDKEFSSSFLSEFPHSNPAEALDDPHKPIDHVASNPSLPPPRFHHHNFDHFHFKGAGKNNACVPEPHVKDTDFRSSDKGCGIRTRGGGGGGEFREHSVKTVATSHCGSNQLITDAAAAAADTSRVSSCWIGDHRGLSFSAATVAKDRDGKMSSQSDRVETETIETAITSSSTGGSRNSFGRTSNQSRGTSACHKRKSIDAEDSDCSQSKDAELESTPIKKSAFKSGSSRKSRAAQVHNLSERRRRDRINEKMRALQELLPHSNKTDKASMLDEAIEYMKSLQLQLQMMWMGSGMVPFMFPGVQQYMSRLGMGIGPLPLPHPHNPMHFPRLPLVDQALLTTPPNHQDAACQNPPIFNPGIINYHSQLQHPNIPEQYANYMQFRPLQTAASQQMNVFGFGPKTARHNQTLTPPSNGGPSVGRAI